MRIGIGYDVHRLVADRKLVLGAVEIPHTKGLLGYSDGDVVLHAISDAMLGCLGLGDIGQYFPNTDPQWKGVASSRILERVIAMVTEKRYRVNNIDTVILAENPKVSPFRDEMVNRIAQIAGVDAERVNIKSTTNEGVGAIGRGEAIAAYAVVMLEEKKR